MAKWFMKNLVKRDMKLWRKKSNQRLLIKSLTKRSPILRQCAVYWVYRWNRLCTYLINMQEVKNKMSKTHTESRTRKENREYIETKREILNCIRIEVSYWHRGKHQPSYPNTLPYTRWCFEILGYDEHEKKK